MAAWGGIASLQLALCAVVWTEARRAATTSRDLARWMCAGAGAARRPRPTQGRDRRRARRRPRRLGSGRARSSSTPRAAPPPQVTPYAGGRCAARARTYLRRTRSSRERHGCRRAYRVTLRIDEPTFTRPPRSRRRARSAARRWRPTTTSSPRRRTCSSPAPPVFDRRQVHRPRQVDGRLGDAPPPHARPRLVHRPARPAGHRPRRSSSTPRSSAATIPTCSIEAAALPAAPTPDGCSARSPWIRVLPRVELARRHAEHVFAIDDARERASRTCASTSFPTAASRGCASTARSLPDWTRMLAPRAATSISRRSRTAARRRRAATCSSARAAT